MTTKPITITADEARDIADSIATDDAPQHLIDLVAALYEASEAESGVQLTIAST